jgi:hypothetical protein
MNTFPVSQQVENYVMQVASCGHDCGMAFDLLAEFEDLGPGLER